jgi:ABC-2 type transport system permease protein
MFRRTLALIIKEFLALLKDRKSRTVVFLPPLVQLLIFGYAATFELRDVPYAVLDEDCSAASRDLLSRFQGSTTFRLVRQLRQDAEIAPLIDAREALIVLRVESRFERDLLRGKTARLQVLLDGRNSNTALIASSYVRDIVAEFNRQWARRHDRSEPFAELQVRAWFNPNLESQWFIVPGIVGLLTLVVTVVVTSLSVAREREQGTFDQLLVTPFRPVEILIGKAVPGMVIGVFEATLIIVVAVLWFKIPLVGSLLTLYTGLVLFVLSAVGLGLMISSLSRNQQQGLLGAFFFLVPTVILSGFATPIANMPRVVQWITLLDPLRYFLVVLRGVFLEGAPFHLLVHQFWPMALIGLVSLTLAAWLFRHRAY